MQKKLATGLSRTLGILWATFGIYLILSAIFDTIKWKSDPIFSEVGLTWDWIGITGGIAACLVALAWYSGWRHSRRICNTIAVMFCGYAILYLIIGDEGVWTIRYMAPLFILVVGVATLMVNAKRNQ